MKRKVIVLGTELEGLLAGHAAAISGHDVYFVPSGDEAAPGGLDFLARPIPMTSADALPMSVSVNGEEPFFYKKLGSGKQIPLPIDAADNMIVWNPADVYGQLTDTYGQYFMDQPDSGIDEEFVRVLAKDALVISSVQSVAVCEKRDDDSPHMFSWAGIARKKHVANPDGHNITLSGDMDTPWIIEGSTFFGVYRVYPVNSTPPVSADKLERDFIPLKTNCDCWPGMVRVGSGATWNSGYMTHHAFYDTMQLLR